MLTSFFDKPSRLSPLFSPSPYTPAGLLSTMNNRKPSTNGLNGHSFPQWRRIRDKKPLTLVLWLGNGRTIVSLILLVFPS